MDKSDQQLADAQAAPEKSSLKDVSLKVAGYSYLVGDAALFAAGMIESKRFGAGSPEAKKASAAAFTGLTWGLGGIAAAFFGNPKADQQLRLMNHKLGDHLRKQGITIPSSPTTDDLAKPGGIIDHISDFLYTYPSEMLNGVYAIGSAFLLRSGTQRVMKDGVMRMNNPTRATVGALVMAGGLAGLLIKEKKPDHEHPAHGFFSKALEWAQEKPLRISGALYGLGNVFMIKNGFDALKEHPNNKSIGFAYFATAASYIFANSLLTLTSKNHDGEGDHKQSSKALQALAEESAMVVASQPKETQEDLVTNISEYLSKQPNIKKTAPEISALLHTKLKAMGPATPQPNATSEKTWEGKVAQTGLAAAPSL